MVPAWLSANPRARKALPFGRDQQYVINPNGVPELLDSLAECPAHKPTPLQALPALFGYPHAVARTVTQSSPCFRR